MKIKGIVTTRVDVGHVGVSIKDLRNLRDRRSKKRSEKAGGKVRSERCKLILPPLSKSQDIKMNGASAVEKES